MLMLEVGHSFYPRPFYVIGEAGVNNRTKNFSDEFRYGAELGYTFLRNSTAIMRVTGVQSLRNGTDEALGGCGGLYGNNVCYLALSPSLSYKIAGSLGVTGGIDGAAFGENVLAAPSFSLEIFRANWVRPASRNSAPGNRDLHGAPLNCPTDFILNPLALFNPLELRHSVSPHRVVLCLNILSDYPPTKFAIAQKKILC
jgi:hypothetical protein